MNEGKKLYRNVDLEGLLKMKQATVKKHVSKVLNNIYDEVHEEDGFVYAKGTYPVLLVAHMDTVHKETVKKIKYLGSIISSPQGIGGDDRCGVYIILELIKHFKCSVLFTEDEEIGCVGAGKFAKSDYPKQCDVKYIVEFDRRGSHDAVFYSCDNKEFESFVESTGYFKTSWGTYSDICDVAPAIGVAAVNLSSGYHNEHTKTETINLLEVKRIIEEAKLLLIKDVEKPFEYVEGKRGSIFYDYDDYYDDYYYGNRFSEDYTSYNYPEGRFLCSKDERKKQIYHIYFENTYTELQTCVEVFAINKMEALGIALAKMAYYTVDDVVYICSNEELVESEAK